MNRNGPCLLRHVPALLKGGGVCLALLFLLTASPLAPVFTALLAAADSDHQVTIHQTAHGVQVVLRHDCLNSPTHRHGLVAQALTLLAQRPAAGHPDHDIQFAAADTSERTFAFALALATDSPAPESFLPIDQLPNPAPLNAFSGVRPRPPPWLKRFAAERPLDRPPHLIRPGPANALIRSALARAVGRSALPTGWRTRRGASIR